MAISSIGVFLMKKTGSSYNKLVDIIDFPDLGGAPEALDCTTLTDTMQKFIEGLQSNEALQFNSNYDVSDFRTLKTLKGQELDLSLWIGGTAGSDGTLTPAGTYGKFDFKGYVTPYLTGSGTNEVLKMAVNVTPSSAIVLQAANE